MRQRSGPWLTLSLKAEEGSTGLEPGTLSAVSQQRLRSLYCLHSCFSLQDSTEDGNKEGKFKLG